MTRHAAFTVVSRNYFHYAANLFTSLREQDPNIRLAIYLLDEFPVDFRHSDAVTTFLETSGVEIVLARDLGINDWNRMCFQFTPFELSCALKPFAAEHALQHFGDRAFYFDSDMHFYGGLHDLYTTMQESNILITPHLTSVRHATANDRENLRKVRQAGTYNAGFFALRDGADCQDFLKWWQARCENDCYVDARSGVFVDQCWLDLVPGMFDGVQIDRRPQFNVAYWNLEERNLRTGSQVEWLVGDNVPVVFFHFSGYNLDAPEELTSHSYTSTRELDELKELASRYGAALQRFSPTQYQSLGCQYDRLPDGTLINPLWREVVRSRLEPVQSIDDPWDPELVESLVTALESQQAHAESLRCDWQLEFLERELLAAYERQARKQDRKLKNRLRKLVSGQLFAKKSA